ncbi:unnamed protein product [Pylaiella littoralis]
MLVETSRRRLGCKGSRNKNLILLLSLAGFVALLTSQSSSPAEAFRVTTDAPLSGAGSRSISCRWDGELHQSESERNRDSSSDSSSSSSSSSRGEFLQDHALGVGLALTTGLSCETQPGNALFEDIKKEGKCPAYKAVEGFDVDKYMGIWYELAYHDWTQIKICGCTRFNMTRTDDRIKDAFTTKCPYEADAGETFLINMREVVDSRNPGSFKEYAFYNKWDNKVVALWEGSGGSHDYERAIQLQCVEVLGRRAFVGINFLSRKPSVSPREMSEMFQQARLLGLAGIGGSPAEMEIVRHEGCRYPSSSADRESRSWGSAWGVNTLAV